MVSFWDNGYFSENAGYVLQWHIGQDTTSKLFGPDGKVLYETAIDVPKEWRAEKASVAVESDGAVAIAYLSRHASGSWRGGVLLVNRAGQVVKRIETAEYRVSQVCFAPDQTLWMYGVDSAQPVRDYKLFRHYSSVDGRLLGEFVLRSQLPPWPEDGTADAMAFPIYGGHRVFASADRIGAVFRTRGAEQLWVEMDFTGALLGQWIIKSSYEPEALTVSGDLYAAIWQDRKIVGTAKFKKDTESWERVSGTPPATAIGSDGSRLVYRMGMKPPISYLGWFSPRKQKVRVQPTQRFSTSSFTTENLQRKKNRRGIKWACRL